MNENHVTIREIFGLAYPSMLGMAFVTIQNFIDTAFLSRVGKTELAAVGLTSWVIITVFGFFKGFMSSTNTFTARYWGSKRLKAIGTIIWHELYLAFFLGLFIVFIGQSSSLFIPILGLPQEVCGPATTYLRIRCLDGFFIIGVFAFEEFFRGSGQPRITMTVTAITAVLNCIFSYILIFGKLYCPPMGIDGAALATVMAEFFGFIIFFSLFLQHENRVRYLSARLPHVSLPLIKRISHIGIPIGIRVIGDEAGFLIFAIIVAKMGTTALAINQIVFQIFALSFMPGGGFSKAATTLVSKYMGAKDLKNARRSGYMATGLALGCMLVISATFVLIPHTYIRIFSHDAHILALGSKVLFIAALCELFDALSMVFAGSLSGAGDARFIMTAMLISTWGIFVPAAYIFGIVLDGGIVGAWIGMLLFFACHGIMCMKRFSNSTWESIKI